jgi:predicted ribonuclease YlaK
MCVQCLVFSSVYKLTSVYFIFVTNDLGFRVVGSDQNMQEDDHELDEFIRQRQAEEAAREQQRQEEVLRQRQSELLEQQRQEEEARVQQRQEEVLRQRQAELLEQQRQEEAEILEQHRIASRGRRSY